MKNKKSSKKLKTLLILFLIGLDTLIVTLAVLYFLLVHHPAEYRSYPPSPQQIKLAEDAMWRKSEDYYNRMNERKPFSLQFSQSLLNTMLYHEETRPFLQTLSGQTNPSLHNFQNRFSPQRIEIISQINYLNKNLVLTIGFTPEITEQGRLRLSLQPIKIGALPIPDRLLRDHLIRLARALEQQKITPQKNQEGRWAASALNQLFAKTRELVENRQVTLDPVYQALKNCRARLIGIRLQSKQLELTFEPLPGKRSS